MGVYLVREDGGGGGQGHGAREGEGPVGRFGQGGGFGFVSVTRTEIAASAFGRSLDSVYVCMHVGCCATHARLGQKGGVDKNSHKNSPSSSLQLLARLDRLPPRPRLLLPLAHRRLLLLLLLPGAPAAAGRRVLLHGRERVDGVEEGGDSGVAGQLGAVGAQVLFQRDFEVDLFVALDAVGRDTQFVSDDGFFSFFLFME